MFMGSPLQHLDRFKTPTRQSETRIRVRVKIGYNVCRINLFTSPSVIDIPRAATGLLVTIQRSSLISLIMTQDGHGL